MDMNKIYITKKFNNKSILDILKDRYPNISKNTIFKCLREKDIKVNGIRINKNIKVEEGDEILIYLPNNFLNNLPKINIIYQDDNILIADKPEGILSDNSKSSEDITLSDILKKQLDIDFLKPCHRLDRNTKGLICLAKNSDAEKIILDAFKNKKVDKKYIAYISGKLNNTNGILSNYLFKDSKLGLVSIYNKKIKGSVPVSLEYEVLENKEDVSKIAITLISGKTHQIRAQLAYINHPIIGDEKYGNFKINKKYNVRKQLLWAYSLKFNLDESCPLAYLNNKEIRLDYDIN